MKKVKCENGHFYDADRFALCPVCGQQNDERYPKAMENRSSRPDPEVTVELPKSTGIDELAPTAWLPPEEILTLFEDGAAAAIPQPVSEPPEEELSPEEERPAAVPASSRIDEIAPTIWFAPDEDLLLQNDEPVVSIFAETVPEETPFEELSPEERKPVEFDSVVDNLSGSEFAESMSSLKDEIEEYNSVEREATEDFPVADKSTEPEQTRPECTEDKSVQALDEVSAVEVSFKENTTMSETPPQIESLAQAVAASHATAIPAFTRPAKECGINSTMLPVGWIVGLNGVSKGTIFPCKTGRNRIGSGWNMDIVLSGDGSINEDIHAMIIYEPRKRQFFIQAGNGDGLTYLNDKLVFTHDELHAYDRITLGGAEFVFVPLCGGSFSWDEDSHRR